MKTLMTTILLTLSFNSFASTGTSYSNPNTGFRLLESTKLSDGITICDETEENCFNFTFLKMFNYSTNDKKWKATYKESKKGDCTIQVVSEVFEDYKKHVDELDTEVSIHLISNSVLVTDGICALPRSDGELEAITGNYLN